MQSQPAISTQQLLVRKAIGKCWRNERFLSPQEYRFLLRFSLGREIVDGVIRDVVVYSDTIVDKEGNAFTIERNFHPPKCDRLTPEDLENMCPSEAKMYFRQQEDSWYRKAQNKLFAIAHRFSNVEIPLPPKQTFESELAALVAKYNKQPIKSLKIQEVA
jgi:hypothetical protein